MEKRQKIPSQDGDWTRVVSLTYAENLHSMSIL